jgi:transposase-like protein
MDKNWLAAIAQRDAHLYRAAPNCPNCDSEQVQIKSRDFPARWKCRSCFVYFNHEPAVNGQDDARKP